MVLLCIITMQYGYVGSFVVDGELCNVAVCHTRVQQFILDQSLLIKDQIAAELNSIISDADIYHNKAFPVSKGYGHIISHTVTIIEISA